MFKVGRSLVTTGVLALGLAVWGCEQGVEPVDQPLRSDQTASSLLGSLTNSLDLTSIEDLLPVEAPLSAEKLSELRGLQSIRATVDGVTTTLVTAVIDPLVGGRLELAGHVLTIPAGAVLAPTRFTMRLVPNGGVEVDLRATQVELGNIGSSGFETPVRLALSYKDADADDPDDLVIVRVGTGERLETRLDERNSRVWAELDHFSRYRLCSN